jgi:1-acyl-sn-glycerol-3-phosphate acyltransferase
MLFAFPLWSGRRRRLCIGRWSRDLLRILCVRLHVHGEPVPLQTGVMLVANHISWIDIFVLNAARTSCFVAKSEIRRWPLIGWLASCAGTFFITRGRRREAGRIGKAIGEALREGGSVAFFPEGTTTDGSRVLAFHGSLLQPAIDCGARIQPVALRYERFDGSLCAEAAYDGDRTLLDTLRDMATQHVIHVHLHFLSPVAGQDRRAVAREAHDAIRERLEAAS